MPSFRQGSFAGGELAPTFYGRTDLEKHRAGLRTLLNFFVAKHGAAVSRPGTIWLGRTNGSAAARLVPFIYSDGSAYVLEFTAAGTIRFWYFREQLDDGGGVLPYEVTGTPYNTVPILRALKFTQSGDVLTITHPTIAPHELVRNDHRDWTLTEIDFELPAFDDYAPADPAVTEPWPVPDAEHLEKVWHYRVTALVRFPDGRILESAPFEVTQTSNGDKDPGTRTAVDWADDTFVVHPDDGFQVTLTWWSNGLFSPPNEVVGYNVYRGRGGLYGWIGRTPQVPGSTEYPYSGADVALGEPHAFVDVGNEPDYARPPPKGTNPFDVLGYNGAVLGTAYPVAVCFFEQRLVFGGGNDRPVRLVFSGTGNFLDFDERLIPNAAGAIDINLAALRREAIRWLLPLEELIVGTDGGIWTVGGPLVSPGPIDARKVNGIGSTSIDPVVVDGAVLYEQAMGGGVRELGFSQERGGYAGRDLTTLASHLFVGHTIVAWAYAREPWGVTWIVRDDGVLLSLTYDREEGLFAFARHETDGEVEDVCVVPNGNEGVDDVYLLVKRTIDGTEERYVELLADRVITAAAEAVCLDAAVTYRATPAPTYHVLPQIQVMSGLDHLEGEEVAILADGQVLDRQIVSGGQVDLKLGGATIPAPGAVVVHAGLPYECDLELLDVAEARERQKAVKRVIVEAEASRGFFAGNRLPDDGEDIANVMQEYRQRTTSASYDAIELETGKLKVRIRSKWTEHGRVSLRQQDPLPLTVLAITREGEAGD